MVAHDTPKIRILIAASGSGGHLFPALHITKAFQRLLQDKVVIEFVGSGRELEKKIFGGANIACHAIDIVGVKNRGLIGALQFAMRLPRAVWQVAKLFRAYRPDVVVGVGGYASVLPVVAGRISGVPTWIHEAEIHPGMANRALSYITQKISIAFENATIGPKTKVVFTGHPVRDGLGALGSKEYPAEYLPQKVLVIGGSQGANAIDFAVSGMAGFLKAKNIEVFHQCRPENEASIRKAYEQAGLTFRVQPFITEMVEAYDWADVIICRSGAGTVMEIGVINKPTIFVPFPFAQGGHQKINAMTLVVNQKALLVEEGNDFGKRLERSLEIYLEPHTWHATRKIASQSRSVNAAETIARGCIEMVGVEKPVIK